MVYSQTRINTKMLVKHSRKLVKQFFLGICPSQGLLLPVLGPCERYMTPTIDVALLISSRAGTDRGLSSDFVAWHFISLPISFNSNLQLKISTKKEKNYYFLIHFTKLFVDTFKQCRQPNFCQCLECTAPKHCSKYTTDKSVHSNLCWCTKETRPVPVCVKIVVSQKITLRENS